MTYKKLTLCKFFRFKNSSGQVFLVYEDDATDIERFSSYKKLSPRYAAIYYGPDGTDETYRWRAKNAQGYSPVNYVDWGYVKLFPTRKEAQKIIDHDVYMRSEKYFEKSNRQFEKEMSAQDERTWY